MADGCSHFLGCIVGNSWDAGIFSLSSEDIFIIASWCESAPTVNQMEEPTYLSIIQSAIQSGKSAGRFGISFSTFSGSSTFPSLQQNRVKLVHRLQQSC